MQVNKLTFPKRVVNITLVGEGLEESLSHLVYEILGREYGFKVNFCTMGITELFWYYAKSETPITSPDFICVTSPYKHLLDGKNLLYKHPNPTDDVYYISQNTDALGFYKSLVSLYSNPLQPRNKALILGGGCVSKSIRNVLDSKLGYNTIDYCRYADIPDLISVSEYDIVVNCTTGSPQVKGYKPVGQKIWYDVNYKDDTFIKSGGGNVTAFNGLSMLVHQCCHNLNLVFNTELEVTDDIMNQIIAESIKRKK